MLPPRGIFQWHEEGAQYFAYHIQARLRKSPTAQCLCQNSTYAHHDDIVTMPLTVNGLRFLSAAPEIIAERDSLHHENDSLLPQRAADDAHDGNAKSTALLFWMMGPALLAG